MVEPSKPLPKKKRLLGKDTWPFDWWVTTPFQKIEWITQKANTVTIARKFQKRNRVIGIVDSKNNAHLAYSLNYNGNLMTNQKSLDHWFLKKDVEENTNHLNNLLKHRLSMSKRWKMGKNNKKYFFTPQREPKSSNAS